MDNWNEQLFDVIGKNRGSSRAAAVVVTPCQMMVANNPNRNHNSKAASVSVQRQRQRPNKAKIIADFISNNH